MHFISSESGAVTVDWVVLTAALVGLGLAAMTVVSSGTEDLSNDIDAELSANIIASGFRTDANIALGLYGAKYWQAGYEDSRDTTYAALLGDADALLAEYQTQAANVQAIIDTDGGGWGPGASAAYHNMLYLADALKDAGGTLPEGTLLVTDAYPIAIERRPDILDGVVDY